VVVTTVTKSRRSIILREMRCGDVAGIRSCMRDARFAMPYLTGTPNPRTKPVRPWARSAAYVFNAVASRRLGPLIFGARRHWIMAIVDEASARFIGVVLLDGVVRLPRGMHDNFLARIAIEPHKTREDEQVGDAEWGFFLHPDFWGEGIALQAAYALTSVLANRPSWCAQGTNVVRRIWAETGSNNPQAAAVLRKAGLVRVDGRTIPAAHSPRFDPAGRPIELVHFDQPPEHGQIDPASPVSVLLKGMEDRGVVATNWHLATHLT
jgi:RimJ/RimL family protein N-acetyltransferase